MENGVLISAVSPQKRKKDRFNVYIDGEYAASLGAEACAVFGIRAGEQIDEDVLREAVQQDNTRYAFDSAIAMLAHKMRSRHEIETRLLGKGIDANAVSTAIDKLISYGYVDDGAYAKEFVQSAIAAARYGRIVLEHKLKEKGLNEETISDAMAAFSDDIERGIAERHLDKLRARHKDDKSARKKIFAALFRRGFGYDIIDALLSEDDDI